MDDDDDDPETRVGRVVARAPTAGDDGNAHHLEILSTVYTLPHATHHDTQ